MDRNRMGMVEISQMSDMLKAAQQRYDDLALISGLSKQSVTGWLRKMRAAKLVYRSGWALDVRGRLFVPLFSWGAKEDVPRPGPQRTGSDRMRDTRARRAKQGGKK
jgi:hypothetical protein